MQVNTRYKNSTRGTSSNKTNHQLITTKYRGKICRVKEVNYTIGYQETITVDIIKYRVNKSPSLPCIDTMTPPWVTRWHHPDTNSLLHGGQGLEMPHRLCSALTITLSNTSFVMTFPHHKAHALVSLWPLTLLNVPHSARHLVVPTHLIHSSMCHIQPSIW